MSQLFSLSVYSFQYYGMSVHYTWDTAACVVIGVLGVIDTCTVPEQLIPLKIINSASNGYHLYSSHGCHVGTSDDIWSLAAWCYFLATAIIVSSRQNAITTYEVHKMVHLLFLIDDYGAGIKLSPRTRTYCAETSLHIFPRILRSPQNMERTL